jgi:hypothetical protein
VRILLLALLLCGLAATAQAADCPYNANAAGLAEGQSLTCLCTTLAVNSRIYGTDRYTGDSSLCVAAVHAGVIDAGGGEVSFVLGPGCQQFVGSERNGVASTTYGAYGPSFGFADPLPPCPEESAAASTQDRLTKDCQARGGSADYCACESEVLMERVGVGLTEMFYGINEALTAGGKGLKVAGKIALLLNEQGVSTAALPELKEQMEGAWVAMKEACPQ